MDDIHTPSVPSGPATSQGLLKPLGEEHLALKDLIIEKQRVEEELSALSSVLDTVFTGSLDK